MTVRVNEIFVDANTFEEKIELIKALRVTHKGLLGSIEVPTTDKDATKLLSIINKLMVGGVEDKVA